MWNSLFGNRDNIEIKIMSRKPCPTDLTWEEKNPSSYLFNNKALVKLRKTLKKIKKEVKNNE